MAYEEKSPVCVDIPQDDFLSLQHFLGFSFTSTESAQQQDRVEDTVDGKQAGSSGGYDTGLGSSFSDDETTDEEVSDGAASWRDVACFEHTVSEIEKTSPLADFIK